MRAERVSERPGVLVVDDEAVNRQLLESILVPEGYRVIHAADGIEALEIVLRESVDVVILDVLMPRMDGFETCLRLRATNPTLPILIATALGDRASRIRGVEAGADDVLTKPIDDVELLARVRNLMCLRRLHQAHAEMRSRAERETALAESGARLRSVYGALACGVIVFDVSGGVVEANQAACALLGATLEELRGKSVRSVCEGFGEDGAPLGFGAGATGRALATGLRQCQETMRVVRRDGTSRWLQIDAVPMFDPEGRVESVVSSQLDITVRKESEDLLARSEERYRLLFNRSPLAKVLFEPATLAFVAVNAAAERLYQYTQDEFASLKMSDLKIAEEVPELLEGMAKPRKGEWSAVRTHRRKDGTLIEVSVTAHPVTLDGRLVMCAIMNDVTETRKLEEQLRQAQKMEAIGSLAGGIAHDFNNILAVILSDVDFATSELEEGHPAREDVIEIGTVARRAAALTSQLLMFSRRQPSQPKVLALNAIVTNLESMLSRTIGEHIEMSASLDSRLGAIEADPGQIEQVVMNLVVNARDAMPAGGKLTIETQNVEVDDARAAQIGVAAGRYVALAVNDFGCGMDAATKARIFEPFFTTKGVGKGTGLGLSTVFGIVKESGAGITVHSQPGRGTSFRIYFPRVARPIDSIVPVIAAPVGGSERVLVVEDDAQVRAVVRRALKAKGYEVIEANSARAAMETLEREAHGVQLVVTDLEMPDVDGRTMAAEVLRDNPSMKVLYMSGYSEHEGVKGGPLGPADHFIQKPFTAQAMALAVRRAIDGTVERETCGA